MVILYSLLLLVYAFTKRQLMEMLQKSSTDSAPKQPPPDPSSAADFYGLFYSTVKPSGYSEEFKVSINPP